MPRPLIGRTPRRWIKPEIGQLLWSGHLYDFSGYAKANREVLFRVSKSIRVQTTYENLTKDPRCVDLETQNRLNVLAKTEVARTSALLRFYVPLLERGDRYKICFTMMETQEVHKEFISRLNNYYNEVWTPTEWNKSTFKDSGLTIPCYVMSLGVDEAVYKPGQSGLLPSCELLSTADRGKLEIPKGFIFLSIFQPTFRKGIPALLDAFEMAFKDDTAVSLVLGSTAHGLNIGYRNMILEKCRTSKVYLMSGRFSEARMAGIYRSSNAYVSMSLGEGWNLPATEAAACGLPCILPRNTSHTQFADDAVAYMVDPDELATLAGSSMTCMWYGGMPFSIMDKKAILQCSSHMRQIKTDYPAAQAKGKLFSDRIRSTYTWDHSARTVLARLQEIWKAKPATT